MLSPVAGADHVLHVPNVPKHKKMIFFSNFLSTGSIIENLKQDCDVLIKQDE